MIVIILGMHKSGTTLIAKTLHESGINMGVTSYGDYPRCKYEDPIVQQITKQLVHGKQNRHSLDIPTSDMSKFVTQEIFDRMKDYVIDRVHKHGYDWGFKFPDVTLCYDLWKQILPYHIAIGVKRKRESIINHYLRRKTKLHTVDEINRVCDLYEEALLVYNVPIVNYEDYLELGTKPLEDILKIKLKDCRIHGKQK